MTTLPVSSIRLDGGTQPRAALFQNVIDDYADALHAGASFPPVVVIYDGESHWLADGFHRVAAHRKAGRDEIAADVRQGTLRDAVLFSVGANAGHGLQRTNEDKRRAVQTLLADSEWSRWSDREIGRVCSVDHKTVSKVRVDLTGDFPSEERTYTTKHGTTATMNTAAIGKPAIRPNSELAAPVAEIKKAANDNRRSEKQAKREEREAEVASLAAVIAPASERYVLYNEPCIGAKTRPAETFDWIITDPPYPKEFLPVYDDLAEIAEHSLKPGGSLLCMIGQSYLPEIVAALSKRLTYHWTIAYLTPGQSAQQWHAHVNTFWKPILWFTKGKHEGAWITDVVRSGDNDKTRHHWGQSETGMADLMRKFVKPGDTVMDPFMGAGTTGVVALDLGATFTGYDIDKKFFDETKVRLGAECKPDFVPDFLTRAA